MQAMELPDPLPPVLVDHITDRFKALSDPTRVRLLYRLRRGETSAGELAEEVGGSQQNISKHLHTLYREGIVGRRREGNRVIYWIADETVLGLCGAVCDSLERRVAELREVVEAASA